MRYLPLSDTDRAQMLDVIGVDNMNDYYDIRLKNWRLDNLKRHANFSFREVNIINFDALELLFQYHQLIIQTKGSLG